MIRHRFSIRARLTLWYVGTLGALIILFAIGVYGFARDRLLRHAREELDERFAAVEKVLRTEPGEMPEVEEYDPGQMFLITEGPTVVYESAAWRKAGIPKGLTAATFWSSPERRRYTLKNGTVQNEGHRFNLVVAYDDGEARDTLQSLAVILAVGCPIVLALAAVGGYALAGRVLSPVRTMASSASRITAECLSERLPVENPNDEFGRLAAAFNLALANLEDSFERLRGFTADASHELRTPLTAIRSVGEVALQDTLDAGAYRESIGSMLEEADRLSHLVDSLLVLARADAGTVRLNREPVQLESLAREAIECVRVLAEDKSQKLAVDVQENVTALADRTTLRQAILDLIDNAIKYTPVGGAITVVVRRGAAPNSVVIEVTDTGPGISGAHREKVFERFYRVDKARSRETGGAGLGLAIARWALEANGGRIELDTQEQHGSTFRIVLPGVGI